MVNYTKEVLCAMLFFLGNKLKVLLNHPDDKPIKKKKGKIDNILSFQTKLEDSDGNWTKKL